MTRDASLRLVEIGDVDFARLIAGEHATYAIPPGGVDEPETLEHVRAIVRRVHAGGSRGAWMAIAEGEIVGIVSYKTPPSAEREVEIGYGVAASRRGRGHATAMVAEVLARAAADAGVGTVLALTVPANDASQRVLERNGFARLGVRPDPDDGEVVAWRYDVGDDSPAP